MSITKASDIDCVNAVNNNNSKILETPSGQIHIIDNELDSVVRSVMQKYIERSLVGKKKYGTTLDREDLTTVEWINHTQEELMDATLYLEKLKKTLIEKGLKVFLSNEVK